MVQTQGAGLQVFHQLGGQLVGHELPDLFLLVVPFLKSGEFWFDAEKEGPRGILDWLGFSVEDETEEGIDFVFFEDCGIAAYRDDMGRAVFEACAPVIGAGSVLVFMENWDEAEEKDPRIWRYTFDGEKMHVQDGRFVFD